MTTTANNAPATNLTQETLPIFIQAIMHYFNHITAVPAETETPYLEEGGSDVSDVTAIIGVSGDLQGCVYYTAPKEMLDQLLGFVAEDEPTDTLRCDMAGEVANTLSGNARKHLGPGFMISVPVVIQGKPERLVHYKGNSCFVIPIRWRGMRSFLKICLIETPMSFEF
ncbi:MAG TPA: chemotaxis protein CheX [Chthoniobacteraceae bacterium]|nr:chemotaxis protein CheX [Chthoniobacteraceae bacterium]